MKLTTAANEILKFMIIEYSKSNKKTFNFDEIQSVVSNKELANDALSLLSNDQLIRIEYADNIPYLIFLKLNAVRESEQNSKLKQVYEFLKEIRSWI
ncbi:MAG: hypothetical protein ACK5L6_10060 [Anaerorhabdus sp.]|uniref:hypothetical protein n=1 Tax=Anaerorhabdus sp. TaxID=1872524 RepID=UPI003A864B4F